MFLDSLITHFDLMPFEDPNAAAYYNYLLAATTFLFFFITAVSVMFSCLMIYFSRHSLQVNRIQQINQEIGIMEKKIKEFNFKIIDFTIKTVAELAYLKFRINEIDEKEIGFDSEEMVFLKSIVIHYSEALESDRIKNYINVPIAMQFHKLKIYYVHSKNDEIFNLEELDTLLKDLLDALNDMYEKDLSHVSDNEFRLERLRSEKEKLIL